MKRIAALVLAAVIFLCLGGCSQKSVSQTSFKLDTIVTITLYDWTNEDTVTQAMKEIDRLEALLSVEKEGSDLYRLTASAGKNWVDISKETEEVLRMAKEYYKLSEGHFDVTTGPLIDLWNIRDGNGHYPSQSELDKALPLISSEKLLVKDGQAFLQEPGMKANLGAIAKGYIADKVKEFLIAQGVKNAVIDLGRNILLIGGKTDGSDYRVGVQDPFGDEGKIYAVVRATGKSIVTSGVYERYFMYQGVRYHHVLDPFTGFPANTGLVSVTILSDNSAQGDALSTTCLLLGQEKGMALIESLPGVEALFITSDGKYSATPGFAKGMETNN